MPLVNVWQDEDYFYKFTICHDINDHDNSTVDIDNETILRWKQVTREYVKMQDEMYDVRQKSKVLKKSS